MSYDLVSAAGAVCRTYSRQFWAKALELACEYGWQPAGTSPAPHIDFQQLHAEWDGNYTTNDGQAVTAPDARAFAAALERSLDDISEKGTAVAWDIDGFRKYELPAWLSPAEKERIEEELQDGLLDILGMPPLAFFAGAEKYYLAQLVRFCRLGSFVIL